MYLIILDSYLNLQQEVAKKNIRAFSLFTLKQNQLWSFQKVPVIEM